LKEVNVFGLNGAAISNGSKSVSRETFQEQITALPPESYRSDAVGSGSRGLA
jgi:hypothetical protein